jgi:putative Mg2+ transporter-C (MgtC) family protein
MDDLFTENLLKLGMAVLVGGVIGAEREFQDKAAGFRTIILITIGSTLFTIFSASMDPGFTRTRIAANIVTGIGFLGAGAIIREGGRIAGLTTAATIWLSAAIGLGIGAGELAFSAAAAVITMIVLLLFPRLETWIDRIRETRSYKIVIASSTVKQIDKVESALAACSLRILEHHRTKSDNQITGQWRAIGAPGNHIKFVEMMLKDKDIKELDY